MASKPVLEECEVLGGLQSTAMLVEGPEDGSEAVSP